jgi:hypothetical protein
MKQTAVEWLVEQICGDHTSEWQKQIEQAKAMEKEQMKMFYYEADSYSCTCYNSPNDEDFEKYYKETFKSE